MEEAARVGALHRSAIGVTTQRSEKIRLQAAALTWGTPASMKSWIDCCCSGVVQFVMNSGGHLSAYCVHM